MSDGGAGKLFTRRRLPRDSSNPIEAKKTEVRAQPEITVGRLSNCEDCAFEKTVTNLPRRVRVLTHVQRRVQPVSPSPPRQQHPQRNEHTPRHDAHILAHPEE